MSMDASENEPFDPLSEGRAGDPASHVSLHQRGRVLLQLREELRRRESYSVHTRRISSTLLGQQVRKPAGGSSRRFILNQASSMSVMGTSLSVIPDGIAEVTTAIAGSNSSNTASGGGGPAAVASTGDATALVSSAVLALWTNFRLATGFRKWREATRGPTDLSKFGHDIDLNSEARRILLAAESARQLALHRSVDEDEDDDDDDDDVFEPVLSPRALDTTGIRLHRGDLDLLIVWARQHQGKTFRSADDASIAEAMRCLRFTTYQDGEPLFYEGDAGDTFFIIFQGTVAVFVGLQASASKGAKLDWTQLGRRVFTYRTGDSFGETAMFSEGATRTASAIAVGPCDVLKLHRDVYARTLRKYHEQFVAQAQKLNFVQRVALFRDLPRHKLTALAELLDKRKLQYGDTLVTEKSSVYRHCFLVLSGVLKATQTVDTPVGLGGGGWSLGGGGGGGDAPGIKRRRQPAVVHRKVELQTFVANEIAAAEALVEPLGTKAAYTLTVSSAHVEVYVLSESDGRSFLGGSQSALAQRLKKQCEVEAAHRERRRIYALQTLTATAQDASEAEPAVEEVKDSLDMAVEAPESPRSKGGVGPVVPGLLVVKPPVFSDGQAPYLPNLRGSYLFPGDAGTPRERWLAQTGVASDVSVVASPKMLSSCVKKFLFEHSDTLAGDYVERLSHQYPLPPAANSHASGSKTQREERRVLESQLAKMYDSKMHWDPKKRDFVVGTSTTTSTTPRRSDPVTARAIAVPIEAVARPPTGSKEPRDGLLPRKTTFQQDLRATQQTARKLVELHLQRVSQQKQQPVPGASAEGSSAFLHFFADS